MQLSWLRLPEIPDVWNFADPKNGTYVIYIGLVSSKNNLSNDTSVILKSDIFVISNSSVSNIAEVTLGSNIAVTTSGSNISNTTSQSKISETASSFDSLNFIEQRNISNIKNSSIMLNVSMFVGEQSCIYYFQVAAISTEVGAKSDNICMLIKTAGGKLCYYIT